MLNRTSMWLLLLLGAALCACRGRDAREAPASHGVASRLAHATQGDLARELDEADRHGTWTDVRRRWQGQPVRWNVTWRRLLCGDERTCHVTAFPIQRPAKHGWMPALELARGELAKIERACESHDPCDITIEGTLRELEVSGELPTSLKISDVRLVGTALAARLDIAKPSRSFTHEDIHRM